MALIRIHKYDAFQNCQGKVWIVVEIDGSKCKLLLARDLNQEMERPLDILRQMIREGELKRLR